MGIVYLDSWQSHELRVAVLRNALESWVEEQRERNNKIKVTQELIEKKKRKKGKESPTQMKKEGKIAR